MVAFANEKIESTISKLLMYKQLKNCLGKRQQIVAMVDMMSKVVTHFFAPVNTRQE
jgi:hypothetical protein